jgi:hypothetical protein
VAINKERMTAVRRIEKMKMKKSQHVANMSESYENHVA